MFLYWRRRGTYELETLPADLARLELGAVERFSWSSGLDIMEDLGGRCHHFPRGLQEAWAPGPLGHPCWPKPTVSLAVLTLLMVTCLWWYGVPLHCRGDRGPDSIVRG